MGDMVGNTEFTSLSQEQKNSLLLTAAQAGDTLACENLIKSGAELECRNNSGLTPLMLAAEQGHTQSCLKLIDHQAHVNALSTGWENTALLYAAQNGKTETCIALLEQGADISLENDLMLNPLSAAFQKNHDETCFALIEKGASLTKIVDSDLSHLLAKAAKAKRKTVCEILMQAGANVSGSMIILAKDGATEGCLFQAECDPDRKLDALQFAFNIALENQQLETCLALIEEGIDLTEVKNHGKNDLFLAALEEGKTAVCKKLLDDGADLGEALVKTSQRGNTTMCLMIIQMAPEYMKSNLHKVALIGAARSGNAQMCLDLIKAGADVKTRDSEGKTPLFYALGHLETFAAMLQAGAAIDVTDEKGNTPLMFLASSGGKLSVLSTLIEKGADINAKNKEGMSVLQMAAWNPELFLALLKNGADPSVVTQEMFNDLLAAAVQDGKDKIFEQLLKIAPDLNLQIDEPQLLSLAMFYNNSNIINILLNNNDNILVSPKDLHEIVNLPPETAARLLPNLSIDRTITLKSLLTPLALKAFSDPGQVNEYLKALRKFQSNLRQYIRLLPLDSIAHKDVLIAWDIQDAYARVKKYEDSYRDNSETAMSPREMSAAKTAYEVAQNLYSQTFQARCEQYENDEHEAIESIEKEIRDMLLDKLSAEGDENTKAFITQNRETLSLGQDESMMEQASSRFNATDNALHIAWRAYDKYAPTTRWINLFTPPTVLSHQYGAGEQSTDEISWDVRKRAAFYFLALKDKTYAIDNQEDREGFYIGEIAEIRRAHNEADQGQDNPSCYPGTIGRIGKMGRGHSQLAVVNPIEQIPTFVQGLLFEKVKDFMQGKDKAIQARMIYALSAFTVSTIEDTLAGKNVLAAFDVTQEELQEVAKLHNEIIASIGNPDEIFNQLNEFFKNSNPPIRALVEQEKVYVQRQLSDIAYKGVGPTVAQQFRQEKITNPYSQETPRVSMQDFIRPLQQFKQKHQLSFNVMEIAKLCSQNNDEQAIDKSELNGEQRQDFEACLQTVRAKVPALKQKLDEKRELWQELYEALRNAKTQVNSQSLKAIVDEMVDHGKDIKKAFKKYNISLPENTVDKTPFDTMSKAERRKSLQLSKSDSEKPLTQAVDMPPKVKKGKRPS